MADNFLGRLIMIFITVIVGVVLLVSIANIVSIFLLNLEL